MSKRKSKNRLPTKTPTVPAGQKEQTKVAHLTQQQFSGPVPHPQILQGYDQIIPGAAERILRMAEEDAEHQREIEKTAITLAGGRGEERPTIRTHHWYSCLYNQYYCPRPRF